MYRYVGNNPLKFTDPSGLYPDDPAFIPGSAGTQGVDRTNYDRGVALGFATGAAVGGAVLSAPAVAGAAQAVGTAAVNACLSNPALCNQAVASGGVGFVSGLVNGMDNSEVKIPGFLNSNGISVTKQTGNAFGAGEFAGYLLGRAINGCSK